MNHITVVAYGAPNSFVRRVQENPEIASEIVVAFKDVLRILEAVRLTAGLTKGQIFRIEYAKNLVEKATS